MSKRQFRMSDIIPADKLAEIDIAIIGVGAIGRNVALQLAQIGAARFKLIDPDTIEELNVGPQGHWPADIGADKVAAVARDIMLLNPDIVSCETVTDIYKPGQLDAETVLFACVDSMAARREIFEAESEHFHFFCDGRMAAEICRIHTADPTDAKSMEVYADSLYTDEQALDEPCTAKSTCYCATIAAGLMVAQFSQWLRGIPVFNPQILFNILTAQAITGKLKQPKPKGKK